MLDILASLIPNSGETLRRIGLLVGSACIIGGIIGWLSEGSGSDDGPARLHLVGPSSAA